MPDNHRAIEEGKSANREIDETATYGNTARARPEAVISLLSEPRPAAVS
jgi:hypothetical protein